MIDIDGIKTLKAENMKYYKFRALCIDNIISLIRDTIYASPMSILNDPFEGRYCKDKCVGDELARQQKDFDERLGRRAVFSLCASDDKEYVLKAMHLWAYYADNHRGYCLEYNDAVKSMDKESSLLKSGYVAYRHQMLDGPNGYGAKTDDEFLYDICCTKSEVWHGENEYRMLFMQSGLKYIDPKAVSAIYLGCKMSSAHVGFMRDIAAHKGIPCYELEPVGTEYRLQIKR